MSDLAAVSFRPQDRAFVEVAADECKRLGLERFSPTALIWTTRVPSDQCLFQQDYLLLPHTMQEKLQPEEWRPLMASAIILRQMRRGRGRLLRTFLLLWILGTIGLIVFAVGTLTILRAIGVNEPTIRTAGSAIALGFLGALFVLARLKRRGSLKTIRLKADIEAVGSSGGEDLLQILLRIDSFHLAEAERREAGGFRARFSVWPRLPERIRNLQTPRAPRRQPKDEFHGFNKFWGEEPRRRNSR